MSSEDLEIEADQDRPALETEIGREPHEESYNRWLCFENAQVKIGCYDENLKEMSKTDEDTGGYTPRLFVDIGHHVFEFEEPARYSLDKCVSRTEEWQKIIEGQRSFCTFAANWPSDNANADFSYWNIYGLKSLNGEQIAPVYESDDADTVNDQNFEE